VTHMVHGAGRTWCPWGWSDTGGTGGDVTLPLPWEQQGATTAANWRG
jgi:hypothetical protein